MTVKRIVFIAEKHPLSAIAALGDIAGSPGMTTQARRGKRRRYGRHRALSIKCTVTVIPVTVIPATQPPATTETPTQPPATTQP
jgi:hypothetical protein